MMNTNRTLKLTTLALCGVINILGGTIALLLRLPVYLDSIGTVLAAALFGPAAGLVPGLISGLISGMTSDVYAFYYIPVQLVIGLVAALYSADSARPIRQNPAARVFPSAPWAGSCFRQRL